MPRYFIDTNDGDRTFRDTEDYEYPDDGEARKAAIAHLPDIARDVLPDGDARTMSVLVRNNQQKPLFRATLQLHGEWLNDEHQR